jgi:lipopolysaccharide exporter
MSASYTRLPHQSRRDSRLRISIQWTLGATILNLVSQFLFLMLSSRKLSASDVGMFATASIATRLVSYLLQAGVQQALAQRPTLSRVDRETALLLTLALTTIGAGTSLLWAPRLSAILGLPNMALVLEALTGSLVLSGLAGLAASLMRREHQFRRLAILESIATVVTFSLIGPLILHANVGAWTLVVVSVAQPTVFLLLATRKMRPPSRLTFSSSSAKSLVKFGGTVSVTGLLEYLGGNIDTISVARLLGPSAAGQYARAASLSGIGASTLIASITKVLMPTMAQQESDSAAGTQAMRGMVLVSLPLAGLCGYLFATSQSLTSAILGPKWTGTAMILPFYALAMALDLSTHFVAVAFEARGLLGCKLRIQLAQVALVATIVPLVAYLTHSMILVACAWTGCECLRLIAYAVSGNQLLSRALAVLSHSFLQSILFGASVAGGITAVRYALGGADWSTWMLGIPIALAAFTLYLIFFPKSVWYTFSLAPQTGVRSLAVDDHR